MCIYIVHTQSINKMNVQYLVTFTTENSPVQKAQNHTD